MAVSPGTNSVQPEPHPLRAVGSTSQVPAETLALRPGLEVPPPGLAPPHVLVHVYLVIPPLYGPRASQVERVVKNPPAGTGDRRDVSLIPESGRFPWRRAWPPTPVSLPGESHGQRSLLSYGSPGVAELDRQVGSVGAAPSLSSTDSVVVVLGLSCSLAGGIVFPDQGSNPCLLHWQMASLPQSPWGSPWAFISLSVNPRRAQPPRGEEYPGPRFFCMETGLRVCMEVAAPSVKAGSVG